MRRNSVNSASGIKISVTIVFSIHDFLSGGQILVIWWAVKRLLDIFSLCMRGNGYLGIRSFRSKIWPHHSLRRAQFPIWRVNFHYLITFVAYISSFCAELSFDLVTLTLWPFDPGDVWGIKLRMSSAHTNFSILQLSVPELCDSIWSHYLHLERSLRMRRVTWPITGGQKWSIFLKSLNPIYLFTHFQGATTKFKPCYMRKISFIQLWRLQSLLRMRSIRWPVHGVVPKATRNNFLTQNCLFTIQALWRYDDD